VVVSFLDNPPHTTRRTLVTAGFRGATIRRIVVSWWQDTIGICTSLVVLIAPVYFFRLAFRRARWGWLSSHAVLYSFVATLAGWACLLALFLWSRNHHAGARFYSPAQSRAGIFTPPPSFDQNHDYSADMRKSLHEGAIAIDVPPKMTEQKSEKVEIRIQQGINLALLDALKAGLSDRTLVDKLQVAPFMIVRLDADKSAFQITPLTEDKQLVTGDGYTTWAWNIMPLTPGKQSIYLTVGTRFKLFDHDEEAKFEKLFERDISVEVDDMYEAKFFLSHNWQWCTATLILPLLGFVWHHWKRKPKNTSLFP
jgi:hypothetical protein